MGGDGLAVVVLAAGAGSRFGGVKQTAVVDGRRLLSRVLGGLEDVGARRIVVLGADVDAVRPVVGEDHWEVVDAAGWKAGPGASLRAGLAAAPDADSALIVLGDLAWLRREAVQRVLDDAANAPAGVEAIRAFDGRTPGHPLLVRGSLLQQARAAPDSGLRPLLDGVAVRAVDCTGLGVTQDVDTVADLDQSL